MDTTSETVAFLLETQLSWEEGDLRVEFVFFVFPNEAIVLKGIQEK